MSCNFDENVFFKVWRFFREGIEQGNISIQTQEALVRHGLEQLEKRDIPIEQFLKKALNHLDNEVETYVSPDEKALFQKILTRVENGELEI